MKNLFRLSTGIVFIMAILIAGACDSARNLREDKTVEINIRLSVDTIGKKYLEMKNPNEEWVKASICTTVVDTGYIVKWIIDPDSKMKRMCKIRGKKKDKLFNKLPRKMFLSKKIKLIIPKDANNGESEYIDEPYYIEYKLPKDPKKHKEDPILRVPTGR